METIRVVGARTHNLKNLTVEIPKNKITVVTGLSGSGKSSLAFDTIFAEGQRRYIESLSSFVRQFLSEIEKPDFDYIEGLAPAIAIDQKTAARNPRSTVATVTEIYDFLRLLFSRVGTPFCPTCGTPITQQSTEAIARQIYKHFCIEESLKVKLFAVIIQNRKGEHKFHLKQGKKQGIARVRWDGTEMDIEEALELEIDKNKRHTLEFLVGAIDFPVSNDQSEQLATIDLLKLTEKALKIGSGLVVATHGDQSQFYSQKFACTTCGWQFPDIEPRLFSFNNPEGACQVCQGLGMQMVADRDLVIPNTRLTLAEGAVRPWSRTTSHANWYQKVLRELSAKYAFSLDVPVSELPEKILDVLLNGEKPTASEEEPFEGILPNLERRYRETDSDYLKNEIEKYMVERVCKTCGGGRLRIEVLSIKIDGKNIIDVTGLSIAEATVFFKELAKTVAAEDQVIAGPILKEIQTRLAYLLEVGLGYVTLNRTTSTLAGGEAQRVRLATQLGAGLTGIIYILDEPSIGLHPRDNDNLLRTIEELKERGNTVIVVEHDRETMFRADQIIDMGPGAGEHGGEIISQGTLEEILQDEKSITGAFLSGERTISLPHHRHDHAENHLTVIGATGNNLKNVTASFPLNRLICVTGVSGSGKSTLVEDTLANALQHHFHGTSGDDPAPHQEITGLEQIDNIINIDQSPIGRTPRSNPATYTGALGPIREVFAATPEAQNRGYDPSRFSFNLRGGRCEHCRGDGQIKIEMNFLPDVYVTCPECRGRRYNAETLEIKYKNKDISDVLALSVEEAIHFFEGQVEVLEKLEVLQSVGLGYMRLGQPATTLSGGEAQRIKLATELAKRETGKTLYILDEPTTGLHFEDIQKLLNVLYQLVDKGNTVIIIEHNTDVIRCADWIVDLGPDGGDKGGEIVAEGTPEAIMKNPNSITGQFLLREAADAKKEVKKARRTVVHA